MTKDEALKLALEALESCDCGDYSTGHVIYPSFNVDAVNKAIDAIDDVLAQPWEKFCDSNCVWTDHHPNCKMAQPEQEPVAWVCQGTHGHHDIDFLEEDVDSLLVGTQLYTTPPQRKPLKDEEIGAILEDVNAYGTRLYTFARAIEAAHGIKGEA